MTPPDEKSPVPEPLSEREFTDRVLEVLEPFAPKNAAMLARHAWLVRQKNRTMNLTRIVEPEDMARKHILDSLAAVPILEGVEGIRMKHVVDLGTGAGWPGLALAIAVPDLKVTLLDSTKKKITFLEEVVADLGLGDRVDCKWARFEDYIRGARHGTDLVLARAVGPLKDLLEWCTGKWFGHLLLWKGPRFDDEIAEADEILFRRRLGIVLDETYMIPGDDAQRRLVMVGVE